MVQTEKTFKEQLTEIRAFLAKKRKLSELASQLGLSVKTIYNALSVENKSELTGKKIDVYNRARAMKKEIEDGLGIED